MLSHDQKRHGTDSHLGFGFCDTVVFLFLYSPSALFPAWELCMSQASGGCGDLTDEVHILLVHEQAATTATVLMLTVTVPQLPKQPYAVYPLPGVIIIV